MRTKILYILTALSLFLMGSLTTFLVIDYAKNDDVINKTVNEVTITESNTIKTAVEKVYDAVVYIESYEYGDAIGSGTGFIYKKRW